MSRSVFFVDDDSAVLAGLRRRLARHREDWSMSFFECPEDLLGALRPDARAVVVTDWMMDGCTGLELCERLRRFERSSGGAFYVIVMTGRQDRDAAVLALDSGADDFVRKPCDAEELGARIRVGWRLLEAESRLREANRRLQERAATDPLTGVRNRRAGHEVIETELARVDRDLQSLALIMVDLDHFKTINDRLGHPAGDAVLVRAASRLQGACRSYDTVIRWGGEEFLLVCPLEDPSQAERLGERLRRALADSPVEVPSQEPLAVTASVGLTVVVSGRPAKADTVVAAADRALYAAKAGGRNRVELEPLGD